MRHGHCTGSGAKREDSGAARAAGLAWRLPLRVGIMRHAHGTAIALVLLATVAASTPVFGLPSAASRDNQPGATEERSPVSGDRRPKTGDLALASQSHIRTTDERLGALLAYGRRRSPTLRALVERLERSDVVVYLLCDGVTGSRVAGRLTFLSAAGGVRYLVVRLARLPSPAQQIGILAHELRHAVEIADAPSVVDGPSLAREYLRIGHVKDHAATPGLAFDTDAAVLAGHQVLGEIVAATGD